MKCPHCGAWSEVTETRMTGEKIVSARVYVDPEAGARHEVRRVRMCANEHRFGTIETIERLPGLLRRRNRQIVEAMSAGASAADTAGRFGISVRTVNRAWAQRRDKSHGNRTGANPPQLDSSMREAI